MKSKKYLGSVMIAALVSAILVACVGEPPTLTPISATPAAMTTPSASEHVDLGLERLDQGQLDEAISEFEEAIRLDPDDAAAHYNLGLAYHGQGELDEAIAEYQEAIRINPDFSDAHTNLGVAYKDQGQVDKAIAEYTETIRINPDDDTAHHNLGIVYAEQGKADEAIAEYQAAIRINPDEADAHYNLGRVYYGLDRLDEAIVEWKETIRIDPEDSMAHNNLGRAYFDQGRADEAVVELAEATRLDPENYRAHFNLGLVYREQGQADGAIAEFETYLQLIPPDNPHREAVEEEIAKLRGQTGAPGTEYRNAVGGYSLLYPEGWYYTQEEAQVILAESEEALNVAPAEAPMVMFTAGPVSEIAKSLDLEEITDPVVALEGMAQNLEAETGEIEQGKVAGYPAALTTISGAFHGASYQGGLAAVLVEERVVYGVALAPPDQWDDVRTTFIDMVTSLSFFEP
jgi:tetratricopeptide (TPR) repeat protein